MKLVLSDLLRLAFKNRHSDDKAIDVIEKNRLGHFASQRK